LNNIIKITTALCIFIILLNTNINCSSKKNEKDDIAMRKTVTPLELSFDKNKYNLIDTTKSFEELRYQAYKATNTFERMQIFDYLFEYGPKYFSTNALDEFFKHFGSPDVDYTNSREMNLIDESIHQTEYLKIKEWCMFKLITYEVARGNLEEALTYMDSVKTLYPESSKLKQQDYALLSKAVKDFQGIMQNKEMDDAERLWRLGMVYWQASLMSWINPYHDKKIPSEYFNKVINEHAESPYVACARYVMLEFEYGRGIEGVEDPPCDLPRAQQYETLLAKYPSTLVRNELLLKITLVYLCKTDKTIDSYPDSAVYYFNKAKNYFWQIDQETLLNKAVLEQNPERIYNSAVREIEKYRTQLNNR
jgi:hypothetical protein